MGRMLRTRIPHTELPARQAALIDQLEEIVVDIGAPQIYEMATTGWHEKTQNHHIYCLSKRWDSSQCGIAARQTGYCLELSRPEYS